MSTIVKVLISLVILFTPWNLNSNNVDNYEYFYHIGTYYNELQSVLEQKGYVTYRYELDTIPLRSPVPITKINISSDYGYRLHPIYKRFLFHNGIDFKVPVNTPVLATANGVVKVMKKSHRGYGNRVVLGHGSFTTIYAHLNSILVHSGDSVHVGDTIALSGNTGLSTGPHLHYEVHYKGKTIDPMFFTYSKQVERNILHYKTYLTLI